MHPWGVKGAVHCKYAGGINLLDPDPADVNILDLALNLSRTCRWNGAVNISVAEHSVVLSELCEPEDRIHALLHDAPEAYTGDIVTPMKKLLMFDGKPFEGLEERLLRTIYTSLGLTFDPAAYERVLAVERSYYQKELDLFHERMLRPNYWALTWKEEVEHAIRLFT